jgi:cell wall-associated NlpC family hydrolase
MWWNKYIGWQFKHEGREDGLVDCWGLILKVFKNEKDLKLFDIHGYDKNWSWKGRDLFIENASKNWVEVNSPQTFDVVLINNGKGIANHAGVMINKFKFIHATRAGVVLSRVMDFNWRDRIKGFYRYDN